MPDSCALARQRLIDFVANLKRSTTSERIISGIKAAYVGGPMTVEKGLAGSMTWAVFDQLVTKPLSVVADKFAAVAQSALGGFKVNPRELRSTAFALDPVGLALGARGLKQGVEPMKEAIAAGRAYWAAAQGGSGWTRMRESLGALVDELRVQQEAQHLDTGVLDRPLGSSALGGTGAPAGPHRWSDIAVQGIFGLIDTVHGRPWYWLAHNLSLWSQAKVMAMREGLSGAELLARARQLAEAPTDEMRLRAHDDGLYAAFKDRRLLTEAAETFKRGIRQAANRPVDETASAYVQGSARMKRAAAKGLHYVVETNLPFTGVPSSIAMKGVDLSPLGGMLALLPGADRRYVMETLARAGVGSAMMYLGYRLHQLGFLTGPRPAGQAGTQWDTEHKQEWAMKFSADGDWHSMKNFMPFALPAMIGASISAANAMNRRAGAEDETATAQIARIPAYVGQAVTAQTYLMQVQRIIEALKDPNAKFSNLLASQVPVPQLVGDVTRAIDPVVRQADTFRDQLVRHVPIASTTLPPRVDELGRPLRTDDGPLGRLTSIVDVTKTTRPFATPGLTEMDRLGITMGQPPKTVSVPDAEGRMQKQRLDPERWRQLVRDVGPATLEQIDQMVTSPDWRNPQLSDEDRVDMIKQVIRAYRASGRSGLAQELYQLSNPR